MPGLPRAYELRPRDVGRLLGLHRNTVVRIPPDDLPYVRFGARGDRRYNASDVQAYIALRLVSDERDLR